MSRLPAAATVVCFVMAGAALAAPGMSGPDDRRLTDPKSIASPAAVNVPPVAIEDLYVTRLIDSAALSRDGADVAVTTNLTGRVNLWKVSVDGSWPVQLVHSDDRQTEARWSPDGRSIAYSQDRGGNELWDIYLVARDGGAPVNLTGTPDVREQHPVWSPDGKLIACAYKPQRVPSYDLAVIDVGTHALRKLTDEKDPQRTWDVIGFSADSRILYANRLSAGDDEADVYAVDIASGRQTNLTPHQGKELNVGTDVSPDGRTLLVTSNRKGGYSNAALLDVATRRLAWVTSTQWEVSTGSFSPDGKRFTYAINADGRSTLYLADRRGGRPVALELPAGVNTFPTAQHFSADGRKILVQHEALNTPNDLWIVDTRTNRARQLTHMAIAGLSPQTLPAAQLVHYASFDGKVITAVLQMPFNLKRDGSNPAIIAPHGGPTWQASDYWNRWSNALAARGYIVLMPNPRGSTGYGVEFQHANYQDLGGGDLEDEVYGLEWLLASGYADRNRIGVFGGSYGGFMTLMLAARQPARFAAAVDLYGPLDFFSMLQHADPNLAEYVRSLLGDPEKDRKVYETNSPINYVRDIRAPLLVLQGDNDPRIPREESERLVEMLKQQGNVVEVVYYPDEGHGFDKLEHQIDAARRIVAWFDRYLKNRSTAAPDK